MSQNRWIIYVAVVLVAVIMATSLVACGKANQSPTITSLEADPISLNPGEGSSITCIASDPDGDALSYAWTCTGGAVSGAGAQVTWVAPSVVKNYSVGVTVSDGKGGTANRSVSVAVAVPTPTPTPAPTPTPTPTPSPSDGSIDVKSGTIDGAKVIIDGTDTHMVTPYVATHISAGNHNVKLEKLGYKWRVDSVTVVGGETSYINWELEFATLQSVTLQPGAAAGKDAYTVENAPGNNYDGVGFLYADASIIGTQTRTYIQFDLSSIPSTAMLTSAWLELYYTFSSAAIPASIGAYNVLGAWAESNPGGITWSTQPAITPSAEDVVVVPAAATNAFLFWDISSLVQKWIDGSITNHGVALADIDTSTAEAWKGFSSSDNGVAAQNPKIVISYYDPAEP